MRCIAKTLVQTCGTDFARCSLRVVVSAGRWWLAFGCSVLCWCSVFARVVCLVAIGSVLCGRCWLLVGSGGCLGGWRRPAWVRGPRSSGRFPVGVGGGWAGRGLWRRRVRGFSRRGIGPMRADGGCLRSGAAGAGCVWRDFRVTTGRFGLRSGLQPVLQGVATGRDRRGVV